MRWFLCSGRAGSVQRLPFTRTRPAPSRRRASAADKPRRLRRKAASPAPASRADTVTVRVPIRSAASARSGFREERVVELVVEEDFQALPFHDLLALAILRDARGNF